MAERDGNAAPDPVEPTATLRELRELLLGPELLGPQRDQIVEIRHQLEQLDQVDAVADVDVEQLSHALPEAIVRRSRRDRQLTQAMLPSVEEAIRTSVRRRPRVLVEALFPVIGPAIRRAIRQTLEGMMQSLNQALEYGLSPRGLRWRIEAWRTRRSFAEVVLVHTLAYRVERVVLVHRRDGTLLDQVALPSIATDDSDLIAAMLTAIRDFVHDSFEVGPGDAVEVMRAGDVTVRMAQGPEAIVAAVIRGVPPVQLQVRLEEVVEAVQLELGEALAEYDGATEPFAEASGILEQLLEVEYAETARRSPLGRVLLVIAAVGLVAWLGWSWLRGRELQAAVARLEAEPGVTVTAAERRGGRLVIHGLRDPLAREPAAVLAEGGLDADSVVATWEEVHTADPALALARCRAILAPPGDVSLELRGGVLRLTGAVTADLARDARRLAGLVPGVREVVSESSRTDPPVSVAPYEAEPLVPGERR